MGVASKFREQSFTGSSAMSRWSGQLTSAVFSAREKACLATELSRDAIEKLPISCITKDAPEVPKGVFMFQAWRDVNPIPLRGIAIVSS